MLNRHSRPMIRFFTYFLLCISYIGCFAQSIEALERKLERTTKVEEQVNLLNQLAFSLHNQFPTQTLKRSQEAIRLITKAKESMPIGEVVAYKNMGLAYWRLANYDSSLYYLHIAIRMAEVIENDSLTAKVISNIGLVHREKGEYAQSLKNSFKAYRVFQQLGDRTNEAVIANNIGVVYGLMENHREALNYYNHSINLGRSIQNELVICGNLNSIGETYYYLGEVQSGIEYLEKAIIYCGAIRNNVYLSQALFNKAAILTDRGNYQEAIDILLDALTIQKEIGELRGLAKTHNALGALYLQLNDVTSAWENLQQAYAISTENKLIEPLQRYYFTKIRIDSIRREYASAKEDKAMYKALTDSLFHLKGFAEISDIILRYETENLQIERKLQDEAIKAQKAKNKYTYVLLGSLLIIIVILVFLIRSKSQTNKQLLNLNVQIMRQKEEIDKQSEALRSSNSELQNTVNQLMETQQQLVSSEKMATLGQLAAGIAHEINNPLNFIKGGIVALEQEFENDVPAQKSVSRYFEVIDEGINRAAKIVKSLSHFSRLNQSMTDECNLHEIIDNCLVILHSRTRDHVEIRKAYHNAPIIVLGNEGRLHQAFLNILSNSEQAIEEKGEISIYTSLEDNKVKVIISDTGEGIEPKKIERIMEPFYTTKPPGQGTGLGLSITYNIITEHQGTIAITSEPGEGCRVEILLPTRTLMASHTEAMVSSE